MDFRPLLLRRDVLSELNFAHLPANHTFARTPKVDPTSCALSAPEAKFADADEFRVRGEMGELETLHAGAHYEVRELQGRRMARGSPAGPTGQRRRS